MLKRKIVVAVTGASGAIYAKVLLDKISQLDQNNITVGVVMSDNARDVWKYELDNDNYTQYPYQVFDKNDFMAPFASVHAQWEPLAALQQAFPTTSLPVLLM